MSLPGENVLFVPRKNVLLTGRHWSVEEPGILRMTQQDRGTADGPRSQARSTPACSPHPNRRRVRGLMAIRGRHLTDPLNNGKRGQTVSLWYHARRFDRGLDRLKVGRRKAMYGAHGPRI